MKVLWSTEIKDIDGNVVYKEEDKSNLIMQRAAGYLLRRLLMESTLPAASALSHIVFGHSDNNSTDNTLSTLESEDFRVAIPSAGVTVINSCNTDPTTDSAGSVNISYTITVPSDIILLERGIVFNGTALSETGSLFCRYTHPGISLNAGMIITGNVRILMSF